MQRLIEVFDQIACGARFARLVAGQRVEGHIGGDKESRPLMHREDHIAGSSLCHLIGEPVNVELANALVPGGLPTQALQFGGLF